MDDQLNPYITGISTLFYILAIFVSFGTLARVRRIKISTRSWIIGGGAITGLGIWVAHFLGMLANTVPLYIDYSLGLTIISVSLAVILAVGFTQYISSNESLTIKENIFIAIIVTFGILFVHYLGTRSMNIYPFIEFNIVRFSVGVFLLFFASLILIRQSSIAANKGKIFSLQNLYIAIIIGVIFSLSHINFEYSLEILPVTENVVQSFGISAVGVSVLVASSVFVLLLVNAIILTYDVKLFEKEWESSLKEYEKSQETLDIAKKVTEQLAVQYKESEEFNRKLFDTVANSVFVVDKYGYVVRVNKAAENVTGYFEAELTGKEFSSILIPNSELDKFNSIFTSILAGKNPEHHTGTLITASGKIRVMDWYYTELLDEESNVEFIIASGTDITEQKMYEETMRLAAVAFETSEAIFITDNEGSILRVNEAFTEITGYSEEESFGNNPSFLKSGKHNDDFYKDMWSQLGEKGIWYGEIWNKRKNGEIYPEWLRITSVKDDDGELTNYVASFSDLTDMKLAEEQIHFYSNFDAATKLPNSKLFIEILEKELEVARLETHYGSLLFVELIHLDKLTDNIGIGSVDSYINQLIKRFHEKYGKDYLVGRISNTDIAILLDNIGMQQVISQSVDVAEFILNVVKGGLFINDKIAYINANVGIVDYSNNDSYADELLQKANTAANRARKIEHDSYQFYSEYMQQVASDHYQLEVALRESIERDELELLLQPQVDINDNLIGAEALLRWNRDSGVVSPDKFIPIAEESNLIIDIGDWVLWKATEYIKKIESIDMPESFKNISVNVSAIQIQQENFLAKLKKLIIEQNISPQYLKLEITETAVLEKPHVVINKFASLKEIGVSVALDDFGTGYSSLSYLQKMQIDQLKIDRSFVTDLAINKTSQALTETIIVMAKNLGMEVIAEGVENQREKTILASYGCTQYQGFYYSRPIDFDAFLDYSRHPIQV